MYACILEKGVAKKKNNSFAILDENIDEASFKDNTTRVILFIHV